MKSRAWTRVADWLASRSIITWEQKLFSLLLPVIIIYNLTMAAEQYIHSWTNYNTYTLSFIHAHVRLKYNRAKKLLTVKWNERQKKCNIHLLLFVSYPSFTFFVLFKCHQCSLIQLGDIFFKWLESFTRIRSVCMHTWEEKIWRSQTRITVKKQNSRDWCRTDHKIWLRNWSASRLCVGPRDSYRFEST